MQIEGVAPKGMLLWVASVLLLASLALNGVLAFWLVDLAVTADHSRSQQKLNAQYACDAMKVLEHTLVGRGIAERDIEQMMVSFREESGLVNVREGEVEVGSVVIRHSNAECRSVGFLTGTIDCGSTQMVKQSHGK